VILINPLMGALSSQISSKSKAKLPKIQGFYPKTYSSVNKNTEKYKKLTNIMPSTLPRKVWYISVRN